MPRTCDICGRTLSVGNTIARSGSPKYKGGIGLHTGGVTKRQFCPNLQKIQVFVDGAVKRMRVCSRCIKAGKVRRPPVRPGQLKKAAAKAEARRLAEQAAEAARLVAEALKAAQEASAEGTVETPTEVSKEPADETQPTPGKTVEDKEK